MTTYQEKLTTLKSYLTSMDIPNHHKKPSNNNCLRWLAKYMPQRNADHPKFAEAAVLLKDLGFEVRDTPASG